MSDLSKHPYFETWRDQASGVLSYLLSEKVARFRLWGNGLFYTTTAGNIVNVALSPVADLLTPGSK